MVDLDRLQRELSTVSHSDEALRKVAAAVADLTTQQRIELWGRKGALVRPPILPSDAVQLGFTEEADRFVVLQGDIVQTESAYFFGERVCGAPKFAVLNSSCDLVPLRRSSALLLKISEIKPSDPQAKSRLGQLAKFSRRNAMYLPALPADAQDVAFQELQFDQICQIPLADLMLANRVASMSLLGWRIFGSFCRAVLVRATPREEEIRKKLEPPSPDGDSQASSATAGA